jgi:hypothetical protein
MVGSGLHRSTDRQRSFWTSLIDVRSTEIIGNDARQVLDEAIRLRRTLIPISLDLEFVQQLEGQHFFRCQADTLNGTETERLISVKLDRPTKSTTAQIVVLPACTNLLQGYTESLVLVAEKDDDSGVNIYRRLGIFKCQAEALFNSAYWSKIGDDTDPCAKIENARKDAEEIKVI